MEYRQACLRLAELKGKIDAEVSHVGTIDVAKLEEELAAAVKLQQKKREKRAEASGALAAITARIREHEAELNQPAHKEAEAEFRNLSIQLKARSPLLC